LESIKKHYENTNKGLRRGEERNPFEIFGTSASETDFINIKKTISNEKTSVFSLQSRLISQTIHCFHHLQPFTHHNLQPTFSTMHFNLAIGTMLSAALFCTTHATLFETNEDISTLKAKNELGARSAQAHVVCEAGLSDTNICENTYCACSGDTIFCVAGVTCLSTCVCAA
jgi:hypothetical protein